MSDDDFTPVTHQVRAVYGFAFGQWHREKHQVEFDRWLAAHDRATAAKALRDAGSEMLGTPLARDEVESWLFDRADRIEADNA